jgi:hypothetical protein
MLNWLVRLWHKVEALIQRQPATPQPYHRSNLHGRR